MANAYQYDWDKEIAIKRSDGGKTPVSPIKAGFHRIGVAFPATSDLPDTGINRSFQRTMNSPVDFLVTRSTRTLAAIRN